MRYTFVGLRISVFEEAFFVILEIDVEPMISFSRCRDKTSHFKMVSISWKC